MIKHDFWMLLSILFAFVFSQTIFAQKRMNYSHQSDYYHFMYVSLAGGYSCLDEFRNTDMSTYGHFGGLAGVGYEMRVNNFWLSVGGDVELIQSKSFMTSPYTLHRDALDTQGKPIVMNYEISSQTDQSRFVYADIPLMVGGYYNMFYAGAGVKVGFPIKTTTSTRVNYSTSGTYSQYIEDFEEMGNHFYGNYDTLTNTNINPNMNVAIIGEIGVDVLANIQSHSDYCHILKVGFYFECGVLPMMNQTLQSMERVNFPSNNATILTANPHYLWKDASYTTHPYFVGLKLTYMFGGSKRKNSGVHHHGCMCYGN